MKYIRKEKKLVTIQNIDLDSVECIFPLLEILFREQVFIEIEFKDPKTRHVAHKTDTRIKALDKENNLIDITVYYNKTSFYNIKGIHLLDIDVIGVTSDREKTIIKNKDLSRFALLDLGDLNE